jgi:hypothetical protein
MSTIYKVARGGKTIGDFKAWELKEWLANDRLRWTDDYWHAGMTGWAKLETIRAPILAAQKPTPPTPPPMPPKQGGKDQALPGCVHFVLLPIGVIVFLIGGLVLLSGLTGNPDGSAIRQAVLAQHMTNGILLMILGVLIAKP